MGPLLLILKIASSVVSVYAFLCMLRIIFTWIPQVNVSPFGNFLAKICDPYLNLFRNVRWVKIGNFDFGPAIALCILGAVSAILGSFSARVFSLSYLLQTVVGLVWNIVNSIIVFFVIVMIIRVVFLCVNKNSYVSNPILNFIDETLGRMAERVSKTFTGNRRVEYKTQLITTIIVFIVICIAGSLLVGAICNLIGLIKI